MLKKNISGKTLNENCKALKDIEKSLSNKDFSKKYRTPPNINSTWIKNKEKYFEALEDNCSSKNEKVTLKNLTMLCFDGSSQNGVKTFQQMIT